MKQTDETTRYAQMGMAALLPGMMHMLTLMQSAIEEMRAALGQMQVNPRRKAGRPKRPLTDENAAEVRSGWPADPAERKAEMRRRMAVAEQKREAKRAAEAKEKKFRASDPRNPNYAAWKKNVKRAAKRRWNTMTPRARKEKLAQMVAGRSKKKVAHVLAVAS